MKIFVYDEYTPEDMAMMQALYSRSALSVVEHVEKVKASGSGSFMERFYVGYGHASIADCGSTTLFIEGVSMLAAKAIQDWSLYSGQETSSRYIDFTNQKIEDPVGTTESKNILAKWLKFYIESNPRLIEFLKEKYPIKEGEKEGVYDKAIQARAFDILRGFLPAGITTQLSWHTNLRQAHDKLTIMRHHPLKEIRAIAEEIESLLKSRYPHSFEFPIIEEQESYREFLGEKYNYFLPTEKPQELICTTNIKPEELAKYTDIIEKRPAKTGFPHFMTELGTVTFDYLLDFGSFRDIQRHRNGVCRMPLLTTDFGFSNWYLEQLPEDLRIIADKLISEQKEAIVKLNVSPEVKQYYIALGFNIAGRNTYGLPAAAYVIELRSGKPVHPSLRQLVHKMYYAVIEKLPGLKLHVDLDKDDWDVRRGLQDIEEKK
ncbi:MAG: FAD-dependent thymidylate synthase [bacterium]